MHASSYDNMLRFATRYVKPEGREVRVLDIGSLSVNGDYSPIFSGPRVLYQGADIESGPNVDVVLASPYRWSNIRSNSFDVVVSGQAFEHIAFPWSTMLEMKRVLAPRGLMCVIAPSRGPEHRYPVDCWRYYPDGMKAMAAWAGMHVLDCYLDESEYDDDGESALWGDVVLIAQKPAQSFGQRVAERALRSLTGHRSDNRADTVLRSHVS